MGSIQIDIKPLSVNEAWQGRRFKTSNYKTWESHLLFILPPSLDIPEKGPLQVCIEFGYSSRASDLDNGVKPLLDVLQKKYGFNDNRIYKMNLKKSIVKRGSEFIKFSISNYE